MLQVVLVKTHRYIDKNSLIMFSKGKNSYWFTKIARVSGELKEGNSDNLDLQ